MNKKLSVITIFSLLILSLLCSLSSVSAYYVDPNGNIDLVDILNWGTYETYPSPFTANSHIDYSVTRNSLPSLRLEASTVMDGAVLANPAREVNAGNGQIYFMTGGDTFYCSIWIKTTSSQNTSYNNVLNGGGGRVGVDFVNGTFGVGMIVATAYDDGKMTDRTGTLPIAGYPLATSDGSYVPWNTPIWTQQVINITIPSGLGIIGCIIWTQAQPATDTGIAWFVNPEVYVNYINEGQPQGTPTPTPTVSILSINLQAIVILLVIIFLIIFMVLLIAKAIKQDSIQDLLFAIICFFVIVIIVYVLIATGMLY